MRVGIPVLLPFLDVLPGVILFQQKQQKYVAHYRSSPRTVCINLYTLNLYHTLVYHTYTSYIRWKTHTLTGNVLNIFYTVYLFMFL